MQSFGSSRDNFVHQKACHDSAGGIGVGHERSSVKRLSPSFEHSGNFPTCDVGDLSSNASGSAGASSQFPDDAN